MEKKMLTSIQE